MRNLSEVEILSLSQLLKLEQDGLAVARTMQMLIKDDELKRQAESGILAQEARIKGIQQFVIENQIAGLQEGR